MILSSARTDSTSDQRRSGLASVLTQHLSPGKSGGWLEELALLFIRLSFLWEPFFLGAVNRPEPMNFIKT